MLSSSGTPDSELVFAWYTRQDWERLRDAAPDRDELDDCFDDWELAALAAEQELRAKGIRVIRMKLDAEQFLRWCRKRRRRPDRASRTQFALHLHRRSTKAASGAAADESRR